MLPEKNRLKRVDDFTKVFKNGAITAGSCIVIKYLSNKDTRTRFGFSIGIKFSSLSTARNRIRRQLRAILSQELPRIKEGYDIVIMAKKGCKADIATTLLSTDLKNILDRAGLINNQKK
jgi:ribonuclease P protein component